MKTLIIMLFALIALPAFANDELASQDTQAENCGQIQCYDYCLQQQVIVQGDTCGRTWDTTGCYRAIGSCRRSPRPACTIKYCYDQCTGQMIGLRVNQCTQIFDVSHGCYRAGGNCL